MFCSEDRQKCRFELCSFELEKKEKDLTAALEDLQSERLKETELRGLFEEQQLQHEKAEAEKTKALEVMPCISMLQCFSSPPLVHEVN